jgi:hypothetical protein
MWPVGPTAIAWAGKSYMVVWASVHLADRHVLSANYDLFGGLVSPDPVNSLCEPVPVAQAKGREARPALASHGAGECLLVYESSQPDGAVVIVMRHLKTVP